MVVPWENEMRGTRIEELLSFPFVNPEPEDKIKLQLIEKYIFFFPIEDAMWDEFVAWFRTRPPALNITKAWSVFTDYIVASEQVLGMELANFEDQYGLEEDSDIEENEGLSVLPVNFTDLFSRISLEIVVNEWMLHKMRKSRYSPNLIIRLAVYQMQTGVTTSGTFIDLLNQYVKDILQIHLN
jgi:hypothetical protein